MNDDFRCLRQYVENGSQADFSQLVERHLDFVYAVAWRQVNHDRHLARDVSQLVFITLAKKAGRLTKETVMTGWLYRVTKYIAIDLVRTEQRRRKREGEAQLFENDSTTEDAQMDWIEIHPLLDQAMSTLSERDQDALILRFFEGRSFASVGLRLALSEDAARMRVERSLARVRKQLARLGVTSTTTALATVIAQTSVAAPVGLAASITSEVAAIVPAMGSVSIFVGLLKQVTAGKFLVGVAALGVLITVAFVSRSTGHANEPIPLLSESVKGTSVAPVTVKDRHSLNSSAQRPARSAKTDLTSENARKPDRQRQRLAEKSLINREEKVRATMAHRWQPFFDQQHLSESLQARLIQLMVDDHEAAVDLAAAEAKRGNDVSSDEIEFKANADGMRQSLNTNVRELLGDSGYAAFSDYNLTMRQAVAIDRAKAQLAKAEAPLTPQQSDALQGTLKMLQAFKIDEDVIAQATAFLSPTQLEALRVGRARATSGTEKREVQTAIRENHIP